MPTVRSAVQKFRTKTNQAAMLLIPLIVSCQLASFGCHVASLVATKKLPSYLRQSYPIYNDLGGAQARPLLPYKDVPALSFSRNNASDWTSMQDDFILTCGVDVTSPGFTPPPDIPRWALPTDNSGLNDLIQNQVCQLQLRMVYVSQHRRHTLTPDRCLACASDAMYYSFT